jgi:hypothetical protein
VVVEGGWDCGSVEAVERLLGKEDAVAMVRVSRGDTMRDSWVVDVSGMWSIEFGEGAGNLERHSLLGEPNVVQPLPMYSTSIMMQNYQHLICETNN